jgi:hypothetical protein
MLSCSEKGVLTVFVMVSTAESRGFIDPCIRRPYIRLYNGAECFPLRVVLQSYLLLKVNMFVLKSYVNLIFDFSVSNG